MLPEPVVFGLPYGEWRPLQDVACEQIIDCKERFLAQACPTGFGKSLVYMTAAMLIPGRTVVLTSTKGLQSQLIRDFGKVSGVTDMRGRSNYPCRLNTKVTCDMGVCTMGMKCPMRDQGGCFYFDQLRVARRSKVVITNYAYWMSQNEYSTGIGDFDMMILDEAHAAPDHVISHMGVSFLKTRWNEKLLGLSEVPNDIKGWKVWAISRAEDVEYEMERMAVRGNEKGYLRLKRVAQKLDRIKGMDSFVWEDNRSSIDLSPISAAKYSEPFLFLGIKKVVLVSATIVPKTMDLLGVKGTYTEYPHSFPVENRKVIHIPTVRMNYKNGAYEERVWLNRIDNIIRTRLDRKGVIHTVSYKRRDLILESSKFRDNMITHNRKDTEDTVREFKLADPPSILVSPSMATGWDFPDDECRWQIILKLPYPDTRGAIIKARSREDPKLIPYLVMQQLIQAAGRGVRSKEDWCETFIIDNNITWFIRQEEKLALGWFLEAFKVNRMIPEPPPIN